MAAAGAWRNALDVARPFSAKLRDELDRGAHLELITEAWPEFEQALRNEPERVVPLLDLAAAFAPSAATASLVADGAYAIAVTLGDRLTYADDDLRAWLPDADGALSVAVASIPAPAFTFLRNDESGEIYLARVCSAEEAQGWALPAAAFAALQARGRPRLVVVFGPHRSTGFRKVLQSAYRLTATEVALVEAILTTPTLETAARRLELKRDAAKHLLRGVMRKVGVARTPELINSVMNLACGEAPNRGRNSGVLVHAFGLTPSEARVVDRMAEGETAREAANALGVRESTARDHSKSALSKLGVVRTKDLARLVAEARAFTRLATTSEIVPVPIDDTLRVVRNGSRRVALRDYGPASGQPVIIAHSGVIGGMLPPAYLQALQTRGLRPIVPQRPGFGLTDVANSYYVSEGAGDLACIQAELSLAPAIVVARECAAAVALEYAALHPSHVISGILSNPLTPRGFEQTAPGLLTQIASTMFQHPHLVRTLVELLRRQSRSDLVRANLHRSFGRRAVDRGVLQDPASVEQLVRDSQAMTARTSAGLADEMSAYARGWRPPRHVGGTWSVIHLEALDCEPVFEPWRDLPGARLDVLRGAGYLSDWTHAEALAEFVASSGRR